MAGLGSGKFDPVHGTKEAAERARVAAHEATTWLREEAARLYAGYSAQSRFFRWRVWIVTGYALIALTSLAMAMGPVRLNPISAHVASAVDPADLTSIIISVENQSHREWTDVVIVLDDVYEYTKPVIRPGERSQLHATRFLRRGSSGTEGLPPKNFRPSRVKVKSRQGSYSTPLQAP